MYSKYIENVLLFFDRVMARHGHLEAAAAAEEAEELEEAP
jgi:hypothetical protein